MVNIIIHNNHNDELPWPFEQIKFDPSNPEQLPVETYQHVSYGHDSGEQEHKRVRYAVRPKWCKSKSELSIEYREEDQQYLPEGWPPAEEAGKAADDRFWFWGIHILTIKPGQEKGPSYWKPHGLEPMKGPGWRLAQITGGKMKSRKTAKQIQREQQGKFRSGLLKMDGRCALTEETSEAALEAAHIIPAHEGGFEYEENGILLRADIHRLFDSKNFSICPETGKVVLKNGFVYPSFDLHKAQLPEHILERVRTALEESYRRESLEGL